jgi:hypothetical protein
MHEDDADQELADWLASYHLDTQFAPLRSVGVHVPINTLDLNEEEVLNLHLKRLERKRWNVALDKLRGRVTQRRISEDDENTSPSRWKVAANVTKAGNKWSAKNSSSAPDPTGQDDDAELADWLASYHLEAQLSPLRSVGVHVPINTLDLNEEEVLNLHLKRLERKRWNVALDDLRGRLKQRRISEYDEPSRWKVAADVTKAGNKWAAKKSSSAKSPMHEDDADQELAEWLASYHLEALFDPLRILGVHVPINTLDLNVGDMLNLHLKRKTKKRWDVALDELRGRVKQRRSSDDDEKNSLSRWKLVANATKADNKWATVGTKLNPFRQDDETDKVLSIWLEKWHLRYLEYHMRELGIQKPVNALDLSDGDILGFHLKRLEKKRFDAALKELRGNAKQERALSSDEDDSEQKCSVGESVVVTGRSERKEPSPTRSASSLSDSEPKSGLSSADADNVLVQWLTTWHLEPLFDHLNELGSCCINHRQECTK